MGMLVIIKEWGVFSLPDHMETRDALQSQIEPPPKIMQPCYRMWGHHHRLSHSVPVALTLLCEVASCYSLLRSLEQ